MHINKIYTPIGQLKQEGAVAKKTVGNQNVNTFWGSVNWLDENGNIKPGYEYDEDQVRINSRSPTVEI